MLLAYLEFHAVFRNNNLQLFSIYPGFDSHPGYQFFSPVSIHRRFGIATVDGLGESVSVYTPSQSTQDR